MNLFVGTNTFRLSAAVICVVLLLTCMTIPVHALQNAEDTIWGPQEAVVYITQAFYQDGNRIIIPERYLDGITQGTSYSDKAFAAYHEAYRQSAYLSISTGINTQWHQDWGYVVLERTPYLGAEQEKNLIATLETTANRIVAEIITDDMNDLQKATAIYNYIRNAASYDWDASAAINAEQVNERKGEYVYAVSAYGPLIQGKSVCHGYAQAYNLLARKAGLISAAVHGRTKGVDHVWNRVWIGDRWYVVDCSYGHMRSNFEEYSNAMGGVTANDNPFLSGIFTSPPRQASLKSNESTVSTDSILSFLDDAA